MVLLQLPHCSTSGCTLGGVGQGREQHPLRSPGNKDIPYAGPPLLGMRTKSQRRWDQPGGECHTVGLRQCGARHGVTGPGDGRGLEEQGWETVVLAACWRQPPL